MKERLSNHDVRVGIVGAGYWGSNLIRNCVEMGILDSVCDSDPAALGSVHEKYPQLVTASDFSSLIDRPVDGILIASPAQDHAKLALQAMNAGKHVFVEKPLALTVQDGMTIAEAARASGLIVFVGHLLIYHPAVVKLRDLARLGAIGEVRHIRSRRLNLGKLRLVENVWWSFAPHDIAVMLAIFGDEPESVVSAQTRIRGTELCDIAYADFRFTMNRTAHIEVCWLDPEKASRLDVFGSKGVLTLIDRPDGASLYHRQSTISVAENGTPRVERGLEESLEFEKVEPLRTEIESFLGAIRNGEPPETDAEQGVRVLKALTMADESARQASEVGIAV